MAEAQQARVQSAVESMVQDLELNHIRKMQARMFHCSADCCERPGATMQQVHQCMERCHTPLAQAQGVVTGELERFQDRLARCNMHCNDKAKDSFDSGSKEPVVRAQLERCVSACVDEHLNLLPGMTRKLRDTLDSIGK
ncbi:protein FAM136A-like [Polyodon spathula]|uniref:protein FAM136A-like n=1 Tax=Polyodon spathula TaxID=7913 RepID=UPI001B7E9B06|nr:protein FAM136A-like [Polyodon spathula]